MEVVVIPLVNAFTVGNAFGIKTLCVHFFAFKNKLCLFKIYRAVFRKRRSKTCFLYLVIILAALWTAEFEGISVLLIKKANCIEVAVLHKRKCISLRTNKGEYNGLTPHNAYTAPAYRHCVEFFSVTCSNKRPIITDKLKRTFNNFFRIYLFECLHIDLPFNNCVLYNMLSKFYFE